MANEVVLNPFGAAPAQMSEGGALQTSDAARSVLACFLRPVWSSAAYILC